MTNLRMNRIYVIFKLYAASPTVNRFFGNLFLSIKNTHEFMDLIVMGNHENNLFVVCLAHSLEMTDN